MAYHFGIAGISGGFIGVDVFFVISGYLIGGILLSELGSSGTLDLVRFYGRRARRLLPASLLMIVVTLVAAIVVMAPAEQLFDAKAAGSSALYVSNFWFMTRFADYFAPESESNPFLHTWSLAVEEQFYAVWPAFLLLMWRFAATRRRLAWGIAGATLISFLLCLWLTVRKQPYAFYASPARAWEFGLGALAVLQPVTDRVRRSRWSGLLGWVGAAVLVASLATFNEDMHFPGWIAVLPACGAAAILISGAVARGGPLRILRLQPFVWVGKLSYSIYLWHWPIIVFATILDPARRPLTIALCCALTFTCALLSFHLLEHPVRASPWLGRVAWRSVALGGCLTAAGILASGGAYGLAKHFLATPIERQIAHWTEQESLASASAEGCLVFFPVAKPVPCAFGAVNSVHTVALLGDSHADQWSTALAAIGRQRNWKLVTYLKSSCPVSDVPDYNNRLHRMLWECGAFRDRAIADIVQLHPDLVIVTQYSRGYIKGPRSDLGEFAVSYDQWADGLRKSLVRLSAARAAIILLRDSPTPYRDTASCAARALWHGRPTAPCDTPRGQAFDNRLLAIEGSVAASVPGVKVLDMTDQFCDATRCPAMRDGMMVYRDANHLTTSYVATRSAALDTMLPDLESQTPGLHAAALTP
jgi:peptidoglycan/LPS O-acetylase OafA/YrhL